MIWATGRAARVADGLTDKRSSRASYSRAQKVLWEWEADPEFGEQQQAGQQWLLLLPKKWNPVKPTKARAGLQLALRPARVWRRAHPPRRSAQSVRGQSTQGGVRRDCMDQRRGLMHG